MDFQSTLMDFQTPCWVFCSFLLGTPGGWRFSLNFSLKKKNKRGVSPFLLLRPPRDSPSSWNLHRPGLGLLKLRVLDSSRQQARPERSQSKQLEAWRNLTHFVPRNQLISTRAPRKPPVNWFKNRITMAELFSCTSENYTTVDPKQLFGIHCSVCVHVVVFTCFY